MALSVNIERPGTFFEFVYTSRAGGFTPLPQRMACIGIMTATGTATVGEPVAVLSPEEADVLFGVGSELALMCRAAFALGSLRGAMPLLYGIPVAAPSGGLDAATETTITIAGTPTAADELVVRIAGRSLRVGVTPSSTPTLIGDALKAEIDAANTSMPVTSAAAAGTVTCTHRTLGVNGNAVVFEAANEPAGLTVTITQTVPGAGAADITAALDASKAIDFNVIAIANHMAEDVTAVEAHVTEAWQPGEKLWRFVVLAETGSLGTVQTLADSNSERIWFVAARNARSLPGEIAAAAAALAYSSERPNFNFDRAELPLYPGDAADRWTSAEVESLLDAGVTPLNGASGDDRVVVEKFVTSKVTQGGSPFFVLRDIAVPKTAAYIARQLDAQYNIRRPDSVDTIRDLVLDVDRTAEALGYVRNVDDLLPQITVTEDEFVPGRVNIKNPVDVVNPIHQAVFEIETRV